MLFTEKCGNKSNRDLKWDYKHDEEKLIKYSYKRESKIAKSTQTYIRKIYFYILIPIVWAGFRFDFNNKKMKIFLR
jgi:hypothetical protein